jgi:hypothetical protein
VLETALGLARRGFLVFPIKPGEKKPPLIAAWQTRRDDRRSADPSWWTQYPQANVGIHCDGLLVIDVDPKKGGYESLAALELGNRTRSDVRSRNAEGGRHIYYRLARRQAARNGVDVLGPGLDVRTTPDTLSARVADCAGEYESLLDEPASLDVRRTCGTTASTGRAIGDDVAQVLTPTPTPPSLARRIFSACTRWLSKAKVAITTRFARCAASVTSAYRRARRRSPRGLERALRPAVGSRRLASRSPTRTSTRRTPPAS